MYNVRLLKGLREPYLNAQQLVKGETITGFWKKTILLLFLTILVSAVTAYFGIGNEILSKQLNESTNTEFEAAKSLFAGGQILWSLLAALLIITIPSLFFWALSDREWKKFIVVQLYVLTILLFEKVITALFTIFLGLPDLSNPFSLGVMGQTITDNNSILELLSQITVFKIWVIVLQYKYIRVLAERSRFFTALAVIGFNVIVMVSHHVLRLNGPRKIAIGGGANNEKMDVQNHHSRNRPVCGCQPLSDF